MALQALTKPEVDAFLRQPLFACLATLNADGSPQQTYVWYTWDGAAFHISTAKGRVKYKNALRDPRVGLSIFDPANPYRYVSVNGVVDVTEERANDLIVEEAVRYLGEQQGRPYAQQLIKEPRVVLLLKPRRAIVYGF